uniref:Uncharacterized protein n=1 Tax=Phlegmariurus squarrosus TaxID=73615 RepID=H9M878_PHLSQ|nr:hypothetical protein HusqMp103 [Phlegmariurus squarrosus]AEV55785.1 hypothetical protein HusqMp103 [Phlegmariurus squarrosus]
MELFLIYDDYSTSVFHCANKDNHLLLANECEQEALFTCFFSQNRTCDGWIIRTAEQSAVFIPDLANKYNDDLVKDILSEHVFCNVKGDLEIATSFQENQSIYDPQHLHRSHHLIRVRASTKIAGV